MTFLFSFFERESCSVARLEGSGAISAHCDSTFGFKRFSGPSLQSSWDYRCASPSPANFCIFRRDGVSPCWPGWSRSLDLLIRPPRPPKVLGLQACATAPGLCRYFKSRNLSYFCTNFIANSTNIDGTLAKVQNHAEELVRSFSFNPTTEFRSCCPGWSAMARSRLTATSASRVQVILLPQPPE
ncbi:hypothetical protein AAY473_027339 [Plecturocebus cupreus]